MGQPQKSNDERWKRQKIWMSWKRRNGYWNVAIFSYNCALTSKMRCVVRIRVVADFFYKLPGTGNRENHEIEKKTGNRESGKPGNREYGNFSNKFLHTF
jgi:hypothetical protein